MPTIAFKKHFKSFTVPDGTLLMHALLANKMPVASSCNGEAVCSKCHIEIISGDKNLSPEKPNEIRLREKNKIPTSCRISCQTRVLGDIVVDTKYW